MCYRCIDKVTRFKQSLRKSSDSSTATNAARNNEPFPNHLNDTSRVGNYNETLSNILSILKEFDHKFQAVNDSNEEIKKMINDNQIDLASPAESLVKSEIITITQSMSSLHAKFDQHCTSQKSVSAKSSSLIMEKLNEINDKCNSSTMQSKSMCNGTRKIHATPSSKSKDPLDWSFSCNQSLLMNDNSELFQLLSGFEKNTWASFDYIRHKLNDTNDVISSIELFCKNNFVNHDCRLQSPVIESIKVDTLQIIQDKFEQIDRKMTEIGMDLRTKVVDDHLCDESMQQLRERFFNLIGSVEDNKHENATQIDKTLTTNDLVNMPLNNELLVINPMSDVQSSLTTTDAFPHDACSSVINPDTNNFDTCPENVTSKRSLHLLGHNVPPIALKHHFHISPFRTNVSPEDIQQYIAENADVNKNQITIRRLTKNGQDISTLHHVNFKIETNDDISKAILQSNFWPKHIKIKPWVSKAKTTRNTLPAPFLCNK